MYIVLINQCLNELLGMIKIYFLREKSDCMYWEWDIHWPKKIEHGNGIEI